MIRSNMCWDARKKRPCCCLRRVLEEAGAHHGREGQRYDGRDEDGDAEGDGELAEEPSHDVAHEQERYEHGDEGDRQRQDGEADLLRALEGRLQRLVPCFYVPRDVLDHDNGVIDDEARRDGEGHQGEVVQAEAQKVHGAEGARRGRGERRRSG